MCLDDHQRLEPLSQSEFIQLFCPEHLDMMQLQLLGSVVIGLQDLWGHALHRITDLALSPRKKTKYPLRNITQLKY